MKRRLFAVLVCVLLAGAVSGLFAQQNPFISGAGRPTESSEAPEMAPADAPETAAQTGGQPDRNRVRDVKTRSVLMGRISDVQKKLYNGLAAALQGMKDPLERSRMLPIVLAVSFVYGLIHALGPGHRKTVLFSYFMAKDTPLVWGVASGALMGILHGAAALAVILPLYYLLRVPLLLTFNSVSRSIEIGTFVFITLFGAGMLTFYLYRLMRHRETSADRVPAAEEPVDDDPANEDPAEQTGTGTLLLIIGSSLVPCPGAAMILLFALSLQLTWVGVLAVGSMSLGMSLTLIAVAVVTLRARKALTRRSSSGFGRLFHHALEIGGAFLITAFGTIMVLGML